MWFAVEVWQCSGLWFAWLQALLCKAGSMLAGNTAGLYCMCFCRSCNLPYVLWVTASCTATLVLCLVTELLTPQPASRSTTPSFQLLTAINRNMLFLFLLANLLTGAVNFSINTMAVGDWEARAIVGELKHALQHQFCAPLKVMNGCIPEYASKWKPVGECWLCESFQSAGPACTMHQ